MIELQEKDVPSLARIIRVASQVTRIKIPDLKSGNSKRWKELSSTRFAIYRVGRMFAYSTKEIGRAMKVDHSSVSYGSRETSAPADKVAAAMLQLLIGKARDATFVELSATRAAIRRRERRGFVNPNPLQKASPPPKTKACVAPFPPGAEALIMAGASRATMARIWPTWRIQ